MLITFLMEYTLNNQFPRLMQHRLISSYLTGFLINIVISEIICATDLLSSFHRI